MVGVILCYCRSLPIELKYFRFLVVTQRFVIFDGGRKIIVIGR